MLGYAIFMAVIAQAQPRRASALIKYSDIIQRAYSSFWGSRKAVELWTKIMIQNQSAMGQWSDSSHNLHVGQVRPVDTKPPVEEQQMRLYCSEYNGVGKCFCTLCIFRHECSRRRGHPNSSFLGMNGEGEL